MIKAQLTITCMVVCSLIHGTVLSGQAPEIKGPVSSALVTWLGETRTVNRAADAVPRAEGTYWKRGALIGAIVGAGAWIATNVADGCRGECLGRTIGVAPFFGLLGAIPGALIGGLFPKGERHDTTTVH